ncbi:cell division protein FtsL [Larsenimonas rhizosphaerae]|uniref:Cell division protein FtsL n=1 Tax=Larsenimonas rhizosphaerae TaxID=2944682 RepID=A0AA41ZFM5_9GAMM|nr:cell division protein FtsL [Larsenimonas rhizosphaerae]MCM2131051.1 cell division protein FtsL [Larsenimonas rhizosphaerae]MCX2523756.1 cell division protein FtsL [Larsenimonas rhizosphaerae]
MAKRRRSQLRYEFLGQLPFSPRFRVTYVGVGILFLLVVISAFVVVSSAHHTRVQYVRLQKMERQHDQLQTTWSRLLLEESTWSSPSRIEALARKRLDMHVPDVNESRVIRP